MNTQRGPVPVSFFGIAVGMLALANAWRVAVRVWHLPGAAADFLSLAALAVWLVILVAYAQKWLRTPAAALAEWRHPVQSSFAALGPVSSMLAAGVLLTWSRPAAVALFAVAGVAQLAVGVLLHGRLWQGGRQPETVTPAVYLPAVASSFVAGTTSVTFGWSHLGALFFGAGVLSWLALESMIMHRAAVHDPLPAALRPTLGIQLAPPVVGGVTYLALTSGAPDLFAQLLLGYGIYQALVLLRLLPWIREQAFAPSYWAFSFGVAALPTMAMRMVERGATGPVEWIAPVLFIAANIVIGVLAVKTLVMLVRGDLLPAAAPARPTHTIPAAAGRNERTVRA